MRGPGIVFVSEQETKTEPRVGPDKPVASATPPQSKLSTSRSPATVRASSSAAPSTLPGTIYSGATSRSARSEGACDRCMCAEEGWRPGAVHLVRGPALRLPRRNVIIRNRGVAARQELKLPARCDIGVLFLGV